VVSDGVSRGLASGVAEDVIGISESRGRGGVSGGVSRGPTSDVAKKLSGPRKVGVKKLILRGVQKT